MREGSNDEEKLFAATILLKLKHADLEVRVYSLTYQAISTIINTGLGRMSLERNETTKGNIVGLPHRFYPMVFEALFSGCKHTNWRLRSDCLDTMDRCIRTLAGLESTDKTVTADFSVIDEMYKESVSEAVQVILNLMWYDWSDNVRHQATEILAHLGVGKPVFDWVINLFTHPDPSYESFILTCV